MKIAKNTCKRLRVRLCNFRPLEFKNRPGYKLCMWIKKPLFQIKTKVFLLNFQMYQFFENPHLSKCEIDITVTHKISHVCHVPRHIPQSCNLLQKHFRLLSDSASLLLLIILDRRLVLENLFDMIISCEVTVV